MSQDNQPGTAEGLQQQLAEAMAHHQAGRLPQAETLYRQVLQAAPEHVEALYLLAILAQQVGQCAVAVDLLDQAIRIQPGTAELHLRRGDALRMLGEHQAAIASFDRALSLAPNSLAPNQPGACNNRGLALQSLGQFQDALAAFDRALELQPDFPEAYVNRSLALHALGQYEQAVASCDQALRLRPDLAPAHTYRGNALHALRRYAEAVASFDAAARLQPDSAETHNNCGLALHQLRRFRPAVACFDRALKLQPELAEAHCNRGNALFELGQYRPALAAFDRAVALQPEFARAHQNRGVALNALGQYAEALASLDHALQLQPEFALAWGSRAATLLGLQQHQAALESCDRALSLDPDCAEAYANRGAVLFGWQQHIAALADFDRALALRPEMPYVRGMRLQMRRALYDWDGLEAETRALEASVERGEKAAIPAVFLAVGGSPRLQLRAAEICAQDKYPAPAVLRPFPPRHPHRPIRIGYYSADFHTHAICHLMAEVFEHHDRTRFQLFAFSFGDTQDEMTQRVAAAMDQFLDVRSLPDSAIADRSRELEIDIAVDLMGFTLNCRTGIFAHRAAPIQVNYLGYPATMGTAFMDYILADSTLIPTSSRQYYAEKIAYLPDTFQATASTTQASTTLRTRSQEGLPAEGFVFCCFNGSYKIGPATFDTWMRILSRIPGSVLWLLEDNPTAAANLRRQAALRGIAPERLVFAGRVPLADHLARQRLADLFLDTLPFNAGATASPALWAGLPVLTCMGETFAGRMAASLLRAVGLPELITAMPADYESLAVELAHNPGRLASLREKLARNRTTTPLFDTARFTRNLEAAYIAMVRRYDAGEAPDHIHVAQDTA